MNTFLFKINENFAGYTIYQLLDSFYLAKKKISKLYSEQLLNVNGLFVDFMYLLKKDDEISILLDNFEANDVCALSEPLDIIYEDDWLLIINKSPFLLVHPDEESNTKTLVNIVKNYYQEKNIMAKPRYIHRLDFETSGLIIFAKNFFAQSFLEYQMNNKLIRRNYLALTNGCFLHKKGIINKNISDRKFKNGRRFVDSHGKKAITKYEVLQSSNSINLVQLELETGRTHQIRVHLSSIDNPILGDLLYKGNNKCIKRVALHSYQAVLIHPYTLQEITFIAKLPEDMMKIINSMI